MNAKQVVDRYRKEVIQMSTKKHDINVQYLYDTPLSLRVTGRALAESEYYLSALISKLQAL